MNALEIDLLSIASITFLSSFGHCLFMCGGFVCAYCAKQKSFSATSHLCYNFGRITTYTFIGGISGLLGSLFTFNAWLNGLLLLISGGLVIAFALSYLGLNFYKKIHLNLKFPQQIEAFFQKICLYFLAAPTPKGLWILGLLNGFIPCGLVYVAALSAASSANILYGMLIMAVFGLATLPSLFLLGCFMGSFGFFKSQILRKILLLVSAVIMIAYGGYIISHGMQYFLSPTNTLSHHH